MVNKLLKNRLLFFLVLIVFGATGCKKTSVPEPPPKWSGSPPCKTEPTMVTKKPTHRTCWDTVGEGNTFILAMGANTHCLTETHRDARRFAKAMRTLFNVPKNRVCILENVYKDEFVQALERLSDKVKTDDLVVIYYSGHGTKIGDNNNKEKDEEDGQDEAFVPYDATELETKYLLRDDDFSELIEKIPTPHILTVIDACFSASLTKKDDADDDSTGRLKFLWGWGNSSVDKPIITHVGELDPVKGVLLSAAEEGQFARELSGRGGRFTVFFLDELEKAMKNNTPIDLLAVFKKTRDRVWNESKKEQMPVAKGEKALFERINRFIARKTVSTAD